YESADGLSGIKGDCSSVNSELENTEIVVNDDEMIEQNQILQDNTKLIKKGIRYKKSYMEDNFDNISMGKFIWCQVSTPEDITQYHQRYAKRLDTKRSHKAITGFVDVKLTTLLLDYQQQSY
ncbi:Hypothetical predicted protein, partial [Mytilus galloprovincialis]